MIKFSYCLWSAHFTNSTSNTSNSTGSTHSSIYTFCIAVLLIWNKVKNKNLLLIFYLTHVVWCCLPSPFKIGNVYNLRLYFMHTRPILSWHSTGFSNSLFFFLPPAFLSVFSYWGNISDVDLGAWKGVWFCKRRVKKHGAWGSFSQGHIVIVRAGVAAYLSYFRAIIA